MGFRVSGMGGFGMELGGVGFRVGGIFGFGFWACRWGLWVFGLSLSM